MVLRRTHSVVGGLPAAFWWLWVGTLVNRLGMVVQPFLILYLTAARGLSPTRAGVIVAVYGLGALLSHPLGGVLTDRFGRRDTMAVALLGDGAALLALGGAHDLIAITVAAFAVGLVGDIFRPASAAVVADLVAPNDRARAYSLQYWAVNLGFSVATVTAGFLVSHGYSVLFYLDAGTAAIFAGLVLRGIPKDSAPIDRQAMDSQGRALSLRTALRDPLLLELIVIATLSGTVYMQAYATLPLAMRASGLPPSSYGLALAVNGIAIVLLQPLALGTLVRRDRGQVLAAAQGLMCLGMAGTALCSTTVAYALSVLIWTLGEIGVGGLRTSLVADLAPPSLRGRYLGVFGLTFGIAAAAGPAFGTALYQGLGPRSLWVSCAVVGVVVCAAQLRINPTVRARLPGSSAA